MDAINYINATLEGLGCVISFLVALCLLLSGRTRGICDRLYLRMLFCNIGALAFLLLRPNDAEQTAAGKNRDPNAAVGQYEGENAGGDPGRAGQDRRGGHVQHLHQFLCRHGKRQ